MRLFAAVWPPPEVVDALTARLAAVPAPPSGVRWVPPEQAHVTLAFLGEVPPERQPEVEHRLARVAGRYAPVPLELAGAGRFGERVVFLRLAGDVTRLGRLAASTAAAARRAGVPVDERPFRAHLTVARSRGGLDLRPVAAVLDAFRSDPWTAGELHLVHSRLGAGPGGRPAYETVAAWPLTGRG